MDYCFDSILEKNGIIYINGWATGDVKENRMEIYVTDFRGKPVESRVTWAARPDVGLLKFGDTKADHIGVFLEIPAQGHPLVFVCLCEYRGDSRTIIAQEKVPLNHAIIAARLSYKQVKRQYVYGKKSLIKTRHKLEGREYVDYDKWIRVMRATWKELQEQKKEVFPYMPLFSVIVPLYHTKDSFLKDVVTSMQRQSYANWELILVNASPEDERLNARIDEWMKKEPRIRLVTLNENLGIAENTNAGLKSAKGDFVAFLDHDDLIEAEALYRYAKILNEQPETELIYSDEDKTDEQAVTYLMPNMKPDFNPDLLCANNYICHFLAVKRSLALSVGGLDGKYNGAQDYDFILRLTEQTKNIVHCPYVLYHWRVHGESTAQSAGNKDYAKKAAIEALNEHYRRCGIAAHAIPGRIDGWYSAEFDHLDEPLISVIIPNKDHVEDLDLAIHSFLERCDYHNYEFIVVENNSKNPETFDYYEKLQKEEDRVKVVFWDREFNYSAINNFGRSFASGEYLLLLNNDTELISPEIFHSMLGYARRPEVGIVGAKLLFSDHTVQHAGVLVGAGGLADHVFKGIHEDAPGYMGRAVSSQDVSAVTAACLLIKTSVFDEVGGLDPEFQVAFNDVDLCLKVRKAGYLVVYDADVKLYHYESKSRGAEDTTERFVRFGSEMALLNDRWDILGSFRDPYYNPNLSYLEYYELDFAGRDRRRSRLENEGVICRK